MRKCTRVQLKTFCSDSMLNHRSTQKLKLMGYGKFNINVTTLRKFTFYQFLSVQVEVILLNSMPSSSLKFDVLDTMFDGWSFVSTGLQHKWGLFFLMSIYVIVYALFGPIVLYWLLSAQRKDNLYFFIPFYGNYEGAKGGDVIQV